MENQETISDLMDKLKPKRKKGRPSAIQNRDNVLSTLAGMEGVGSVVPLQMYMKITGRDGRIMRVRGNQVLFTNVCSDIPELEVIKKDTEELKKKHGRMSASVTFDTDDDLIKVAGIYFGNGHPVSETVQPNLENYTVGVDMGIQGDHFSEDSEIEDGPSLDDEPTFNSTV